MKEKTEVKAEERKAKKNKKKPYTFKTENFKKYSNETLTKKIKTFENKFKMTTREFLAVYNARNFYNFEGTQEQRHWFICIKIVTERKKDGEKIESKKKRKLVISRKACKGRIIKKNQ